MSADAERPRRRGVGRLVGLAALVVVACAAGFGLWLITGPGPMDFAGGHRVALADYHGADPTGAPPALAGGSPAERACRISSPPLKWHAP